MGVNAHSLPQMPQRCRLANRKPASRHSLVATNGGLIRASSGASAWSTGEPACLALLAACGALAHVVEKRSRMGAAVSSPVLALGLGTSLAALGILPTNSSMYDRIYAVVVPMAVSLYMLGQDATALLTSGGSVAVAFSIGACGMFIGGCVAWQLVGAHMGSEGSKLAACLCASYIGGTVNFVAVAQSLQLSGAVLPAAMAADNICMAALLACLMAWPVRCAGVREGASAPSSDPGSTSSSPQKASRQQQQEHSGSSGGPLRASASHHDAAGDSGAGYSSSSGGGRSVSRMVAAVVVAAAVTAAAGAISAAAQAQSSKLLITSVLAFVTGAAANSLHSHWHTAGLAHVSAFAGASDAGAAAMLLFFATIGASCGCLPSLAPCAPLAAYIALMCAVHAAALTIMGRALRLPPAALLVGCNACVGGPATAAGMASARGWPHMVQPALVAGSCGYLIGTGGGLLLQRVIAG